MKRQAEITFDVGSTILLVRFESSERLSESFEITADIVLQDKVDFLPHLGAPALITVYELDQPVRYFHGLVMEAHFALQSDAGYAYRLVLRPWTHLLGHNRGYRIFENQAAPEIIKTVLEKQSVHVDYSGLTGQYLPWPYCTQYRESDLHFISRLMEREGIYYYFRHEQGDHILVLCDSRSAHKPAPGYATVKFRPDFAGRSGGLAGAIWDWREHVGASGETSYVLQSFDYSTTQTRHGQMVGPPRNPADTQEVYEFTGDFVDEALPAHWTQMSLQAARARQRTYSGEGDCIGLACGGLFTLDAQSTFTTGDEFIITGARFAIDAEPGRAGGEEQPRQVRLEAVTSDTPFRAPILTSRPIAGPETAIVVMGGADDSNVDNVGRVRVRFLWGRDGEAPDAARSCWLRVSHPSAGAAFGHVTLPRTNQEVIVDFLDGNPDRPIVTGRVYNSEHVHAYALPQYRTRSLWRSWTIGALGPYPGAASTPSLPGYNEIRFEDKGGQEEVYVRAQRNMLTEVLLDDEARISRDRTTTVHRNDSTTVQTGDHALTVSGGTATVSATRGITLESATTITLRVGMNTIVISEAGIAMNGMTITSEAETTQTLNGSVTSVLGEAQLTLMGGDLTIL
ncbi:MAG: type VI secretion system tip protein TssI/VgrG [Caulobacteraceae bacterium]